MHPERASGRGRDAGLESKCVATAGALFITPVCNCKTCVSGILFMYFVILWRKGVAPTAPADDATHAWRRVSVSKPPGTLPRSA